MDMADLLIGTVPARVKAAVAGKTPPSDRPERLAA
jgi:hypothetical protein